MADNDEKILKALETLQVDVKDVKQDISVLKNGQAQNKTMLEAVLAGQEDLQKQQHEKPVFKI